jgi:hypothetical protein
LAPGWAKLSALPEPTAFVVAGIFAE